MRTVGCNLIRDQLFGDLESATTGNRKPTRPERRQAGLSQMMPGQMKVGRSQDRKNHTKKESVVKKIILLVALLLVLIGVSAVSADEAERE